MTAGVACAADGNAFVLLRQWDIKYPPTIMEAVIGERPQCGDRDWPDWPIM
jgi:hypothetical protein